MKYNINDSMSKAIIAIVLCILLALPSSSVLASSVWKEDATSFASGSRFDVGLYGDHLQLNNTTAGGAWTQLSEGAARATSPTTCSASRKSRVPTTNSPGTTWDAVGAAAAAATVKPLDGREDEALRSELRARTSRIRERSAADRDAPTD